MKTKLMMLVGAARRAVRNLALFAAAAVAFGAWAATETVGDYTWTYQISGGTAVIYNSGSKCISPNPTGAVTVPSTLGGKPVTSIGNYAFYNCYGLTSVTMSGDCPSMGSSVFSSVNPSCVVHLPKDNGTYALSDGKWQGLPVDYYEHVFTVTLNANGGSVGGKATVAFSVDMWKYTNQADTNRTVSRVGYSLVGWFDTTNSAGGNMVFNASGYAVNGTYWTGSYVPGKSSATWKYAGNVVAYARWTPVAGNIRMATPSSDMEDGFGHGDMVEAEEPLFFQGEFVGVFADDGGRFMLTLDEGLETAYFVTWTDDGGVACECEAAVVGDVLILTTEDGEVYRLVWDEDGLVATRLE